LDLRDIPYPARFLAFRPAICRFSHDTGLSRAARQAVQSIGAANPSPVLARNCKAQVLRCVVPKHYRDNPATSARLRLAEPVIPLSVNFPMLSYSGSLATCRTI
jgi:hypothetical protein